MYVNYLRPAKLLRPWAVAKKRNFGYVLALRFSEGQEVVRLFKNAIDVLYFVSTDNAVACANCRVSVYHASGGLDRDLTMSARKQQEKLMRLNHGRKR